jgi:hypothetical protein
MTGDASTPAPPDIAAMLGPVAVPTISAMRFARSVRTRCRHGAVPVAEPERLAHRVRDQIAAGAPPETTRPPGAGPRARGEAWMRGR